MSRRVERARSLLARREAWIEGGPDVYRLRLSPDRRGRVVLELDAATFQAVFESPGLVATPGGWRGRAPVADGPAAGRPGFEPGEKAVMEADGRVVLKPANLGQSPVLWLARRKGLDGRPWLEPAEVAAAERLRADWEQAQTGRP